MFTKIECSVVVKASVDDTWRAFADISRLLGQEIYEEANWVEGKPWEVGSRIRYRITKPIPAVIDAVVTASHRPHSVQIVNHSVGVTADEALFFRDIGQGQTRISARVEFLGKSHALSDADVESAVRFLVQHALDTAAAQFESG